MEWNNRLIEKGAFYCMVCKNFLSFPIMLVEEIGNICGRCVARESSSSNVTTKIRNESLETIIRMLEIPCRYKSEGCTSILAYDEMVNHEEYCSLRQYNCPSNEDCPWRGSLGNLTKHFEQLHPAKWLKSDSLVFEFDIDMSVDKFSAHMLLNSNVESYLLQLKVENDNLWCAVCYIGDEDKGSKYEYLIEEIGYKKSFYFRNDSRKAMLPQSFMSNLDQDRAIWLDMSPLKIYFTRADLITVKLKIVGTTPMVEIDDSILSHLECPICNLYMLPPIHQCLTGHNICCKCRPKVAQCPTCRGRIENTRNYALEAVSAKTKYPCVNRMYGCSAVFPGSLIEKHEKECQLRTYSCIIVNAACTWQGAHRDLIEHLKNAHKITNSLQTKVNYSTNQFYMYTTKFDHIVQFGEVFKIGHKYDNNAQTTFWNCKVLDARSHNKYEVLVTYVSDTSNMYLTKKKLCEEYTTDEDFFNQSVSFHQNLTSRVGTTVKCEIHKLL